MAVRDLTNFLVHLFGGDDQLNELYLSAMHDQCLLCHERISDSAAYLEFRVCPYCRFHYTLSARDRIELIADRRTFRNTIGMCSRWLRWRFLTAACMTSNSPRARIARV